MQVEICVEVEEQVEMLLRCTHFRREDGATQQIGREVLRTVGEGAQHGWSKLVGLVSSQASARRAKVASTGKGNEKGGQR